MFGFGRFGGANYPTREGMAAPQSGQVLSDDDFNLSWKAKLDSIRPAPVWDTRELVPGQGGFDQQAADPYLSRFMDEARNKWNSQAASWSDADRQANWDAATKMGYIPTIGADGAIQLAKNAYGTNTQAAGYDGPASHIVTQYFGEDDEYARTKQAWDQAAKERSENQIRQQQAYDTYLMGGKQIGGVMGSQYSSPAFGQVSGQNQGDTLTGMPGIGSGFGGITGVDDTSQTGGYGGGAGGYNPSPFSPSAYRNRNPWGFM